MRDRCCNCLSAAARSAWPLAKWLCFSAGAFFLLAIVSFLMFWFVVRHGRGTFRPQHRGIVRFALCQYDCRVGDVRWSFDHAMQYADEAVRGGADVIVFPENSFASFYDIYICHAVTNICDDDYMSRKLSHFCRTRGCFLFVNHPYIPTCGPHGLDCGENREEGCVPMYNQTLLWGPSGKVVTNYQKMWPAYCERLAGVRCGEQPVVADLGFARVGMMICKDTSFPRRFEKYAEESDIILAQFAHIFHWGPGESDIHLVTSTRDVVREFDVIAHGLCKTFGQTLIMVNKTGLEREYAYNGGSRGLDAEGAEVVRGGSDSCILYVDFPLGVDGHVSGAAPVCPDNPSDMPTSGYARRFRQILSRVGRELP